MRSYFESTPLPFLNINPLSTTWKGAIIREHPKTSIVILPISYALGCAGYAISLPIRILKVALHALALVFAIFIGLVRGNFCARNAKQLTLLGGSLGELFTGIFGVICPPLAYQLDECIESNRFIHRLSWFSMWIPLQEPPSQLNGRNGLKNVYRWVANTEDLTCWATNARDVHLKVMYLLMANETCNLLPECEATLEAGRSLRVFRSHYHDEDHLAHVKEILANQRPVEFYVHLSTMCDVFTRDNSELANQLFEYAVADPARF